MKNMTTACGVAFFSIGAASAADLPARSLAPSFAPPPAFLFEGSYAGAHIGGAVFGDRAQTLFAPNKAGLTQTKSYEGGFIGGVHAGYDWHYGPVVFGFVGDISGGTGVTHNTDYFFGYSVKNTTDVQGSFRGRVGYAFDRALLYVTGGLNVAHVQHAYQSPVAYQEYDHVTVEPTVGVGLEYAIDEHWRVGLLAISSDTSTHREISNPAQPLIRTRHHAGNNAVMLGVSYRFTTR
jgi:outer membrane immunogenic protein